MSKYLNAGKWSVGLNVSRFTFKAALAMCYNQGFVCDKSLGAPVYIYIHAVKRESMFMTLFPPLSRGKNIIMAARKTGVVSKLPINGMCHHHNGYYPDSPPLLPMDQSHKFHNAPLPYPKVHHSVQKCSFFSDPNGELWDMGQEHCGMPGTGLFPKIWSLIFNNGVAFFFKKLLGTNPP